MTVPFPLPLCFGSEGLHALPRVRVERTEAQNLDRWQRHIQDGPEDMNRFVIYAAALQVPLENAWNARTLASLTQVASAGVAFVSPVNLGPGAGLAPRTVGAQVRPRLGCFAGHHPMSQATSSTWKAKASDSWREASGASVSLAAALLVGASFARAAGS